ncbi:odorant receptor 59b-like [Drosophila mojavensis]|uniref:odorant receptor 59b-like n=1 Tax=Drosophila mojavensis TaxID=7230 RepID=UPI001CD076FB|nr:odorant receptor 59b-like [Drosophila mojavensis]
MTGIFRQIHPAPLVVRIRSRECCSYLFRALKFLGWMPPKQGIPRYLHLLYTCFFFYFPLIYGPLGLLRGLISNLKSFSPGEFLTLLPLDINSLGVSIKSFILYIYMTRVYETLSTLDDLDERLKNDSDRRKIHAAVARSNYIFFVYAQLYLSYTVSVFIIGVLNGHPPWLIYNPIFDWRDSVGNFWLQTIFEYLVFLFQTTLALISDTYTIVLLVNFRAHIDVLKDHIRNLRTDPQQTEKENYDELVSNIIYHKLILR